MTVRDATAEDWDGVKALFSAQGFDYELPDLDSFLAVKIATDSQGTPRMAILARPTVELYMLSDASWEIPGWRFSALKVLHEVMRVALKALGIQDAHAWLPPQIERTFGGRLKRSFQWGKSRWQCYERQI